MPSFLKVREGREWALILLIALCIARPVGAASDESSEGQLEETTFTAQRNPVKTPLPTLSVRVGEQELRAINLINPEDALKYSPNLFVRKRFIGDRNGVLSIRGSSVFQSARELVYADGVLLSNLIENRWNGAPKWQIIAPEEIVSTEIIYGPYSALYSGNAMNGVVNFYTRQPEKREGTFKASYFLQDFESYGSDDTFDGFQTFVSFGDRIGNLSLYGFYQHIDSDSQPQNHAIKRSPGFASGAEPTVFSAFQDTDPSGNDRLIIGGTSFNEVTRDLIKVKGAYDFHENLRLQTTVGFWDSKDDTTKVENYLRDANGNTVWNTGGSDVQFNGRTFSVNGSDFRVEERERQDLLVGVTLEGTLVEDWDFQTFFTYYDILEDEQLRSNHNPQDSAFDGSGRVQEFGDNYWGSYDLRLGDTDFLNNEDLGLYVGYHYGLFNYGITEHESTDFANALKDGRLRNDDGGESDIHAAYAQVDWNLIEDWTATFGARQEWWEARDGHDNSTVFDDRDQSEFSPKFSLAYAPNEEWEVRASLAKAVRFPVITELFVDDPDDRSQLLSNPQLVPEESFAKTLILEKKTDQVTARLAYYHNDEDDTIFRQRVRLPGNRTTSGFINIDEVETQGIEFSLTTKDLFVEGLDLGFNASFNDSEIKKNIPDPSIEGNDLPRVPDWRVNLNSTYHVSQAWDVSLGARYGDEAFDDLQNSDTNPNTFEGISEFFVVDAKTSYRFDNGLELAFGIDNVFEEEYWMFHPFPERTFIFDVKMAL